MHKNLLTEQEHKKLLSSYEITDPDYAEAHPYFSKLYDDLLNAKVMATVQDKLSPYLKEFGDFTDNRTEVLDYTWKTTEVSYFPKVKAQH